MMFNLLNRRTPRPTVSARRPQFRPQLEGFEDRVVPAQVAPAPPVLGPALFATAQQAPAASAASIIPINVSSITLNPTTGALSLIGSIGNQVFTTTGQLSLATTQTPAGTTTPILHLELAPIHLNVLGLTVDTSKICLDITAQSGPGNLLGNLLTNVAGLLNGPTPPDLGGLLGRVLGGLSPTDLNILTSELTGLVNGALGQVTSPSAVTSAQGNILHLSLGPVDLTLLGLNVHLDNCNNGPVTVDVGAQTGPGKLLGNLLNSLTHLLDGPANSHALNNALGRVASEINHLLR